MYEKEEELLNESRKQLEQFEIPNEQIDEAIQQGMLEAKYRKKKRKRTLWALSIAAIFMLTFVTSIRVSPTFANAVSSIPGFERFVLLIQYDKGLVGVFENDYYEVIGVSQTKDNITLTVDGVILDETGLVIFYTLDGPADVSFEQIDLVRGGELVKGYSLGYGDDSNPEQKNSRQGQLDFVFKDSQPSISQNFELKVGLSNTANTLFELPFTVMNEMKKGKAYALNLEVEMDGQKMVVNDITIYPLRVAVDIEFDEKNSMEILNFKDMRMEDENGEEWSTIRNGVAAFGGVKDNKRTFYLQSNYFKEPKELYFKFDKVQALPKDESYLLVDLQNKVVLKQPSYDLVKVTEITTNSVEVVMQKEDDSLASLFSDAENANGESVDIPSLQAWSDVENAGTKIQFDGTNIINPIKIYFSSYPNYLDGSVSIQVK